MVICCVGETETRCTKSVIYFIDARTRSGGRQKKAEGTKKSKISVLVSPLSKRCEEKGNSEGKRKMTYVERLKCQFCKRHASQRSETQRSARAKRNFDTSFDMKSVNAVGEWFLSDMGSFNKEYQGSGISVYYVYKFV